MSTTQVIQLSAGKVIATSPQEEHLDLRLRDRGRWVAGSMDRRQAAQLRDQIDAWLQESLPPTAYERDLAAFGESAFGQAIPMPVWHAKPAICVSITPDAAHTHAMVRTTHNRAQSVAPGDYIAVLVDGENRLGRVNSICEIDTPGVPSGHPDCLVDIQAWFPLRSAQNLSRENAL